MGPVGSFPPFLGNLQKCISPTVPNLPFLPIVSDTNHWDGPYVKACKKKPAHGLAPRYWRCQHKWMPVGIWANYELSKPWIAWPFWGGFACCLPPFRGDQPAVWSRFFSPLRMKSCPSLLSTKRFNAWCPDFFWLREDYHDGFWKTLYKNGFR